MRKTGFFLLALLCTFSAMAESGSAKLGKVKWVSGSASLQSKEAKDGALSLKWEGGHKQQFVWSTEKIPVKSKFIEIKINWKKEYWNFDTLMYPLLRFYDANGKIIVPPKYKYPKETKLEPDPAYIKWNARWRAPEFASPYPGDRPISYINTIELPKDTASIEFGFCFEGGKGACEIMELSFTSQKGHDYYHKVKTVKREHKTPALNRLQINEHLKKRERANVSIQRKGDRTEMTVNGKKVYPIIYKNGPVHGAMTKELKRVGTFSDAGFEIFTVNVPLGQNRTRSRGPVWLGAGDYDITELEDAVYDVLANNPDAHVMFEILVNNYYEWGLAHPDHMFQDDKGVHYLWGSSIRSKSKNVPGKNEYLIWMASLQSDLFRMEVASALREIFRKFEASPVSKAVVGVYLNGTGDNQWFSADEKTGMDFSPASIKAFRSYLRARYRNSEDKLRAAWKDPKASFDTAMPPVFTEFWAESQFFPSERVPDYNRFLGEYNFRLMDAFSTAVKQASGGRYLVGAYWPNGGVCGFPFPTHRNVEKLCNSPYFDFFAVVPQYYEYRECGHPFDVAGYTGSIRLHNKLLVVELDIRHPEFANWGIWGSRTYYHSHTPATFQEFSLRLASWAMAMGGGFHAYDLDCGYWDSDNAVKSWKRTLEICKQFGHKDNLADRIAVFAEEDAPNYTSLHRFYRLYAYNATMLPHYAMVMSGLGCDFYFTGDALNSSRPDSKVMIFSEAGTMSAEDGELIRKKFGNSGRIIVWCGAPGYFPSRTLAAAEKITGFKYGKILQNEPLTADSKVKDPLTAGLEGTLYPRPGWGHKIGQVYSVNDPEAKILARFQPSGLPGMAVKRHKDYTEIFIGQQGALTPQMLRNIAREAGIEPSLDSNDVSYQGGGIISISATTGGVKEIRVPKGADGLTVLTGHKVVKSDKESIKVEVKAGDTLVVKEIKGEKK